MIIVHPITFATLTLALGLAACRDAAPEPSGPPAASSTAAAVDEKSPAPAISPAPATEPSADTQLLGRDRPRSELAAKLADLDAMCEALNRDYGDGTLGDYYAGLVPRTDWGKQQIAAGNATIQPGRLLERAIADLTAGTQHADQLDHCRKLLDDLDDVE
jgi:hypothetical protein